MSVHQRRLLASALGGALVVAVVWGHRLPVVRHVSAALADANRAAGGFGPWLTRTLFLLPAAAATVAVVGMVRQRRAGPAGWVAAGIALVLTGAAVVTVVILTRR